MISHNADYTTNASAPVKTVRLVFSDQSEDIDERIDFSSADDLISASINAIGQWLGVATKKISAKLIGDYTTVNGRSYLVKLGILNPTSAGWDEVELGYFRVLSVDYNIDQKSSAIELGDQLFNAQSLNYNLGDDIFPITVQALAGTIASAVDMVLDANFSSLPNADYIIEENLWRTISGTSLKDIVREIAETTGTTAIASGNQLLFRQYEINPEVMATSNMKKFKIGSHFGPLNSLVLSRQPQGDNILEADQDSIEADQLWQKTIVNNEIMDDSREERLIELFDGLVDDNPYIEFDDIQIDTEGHGWYEIGDTFTVTVGGKDYLTFISEIKMIIDGSIKETLVSEVLDDAASINRATAGGVLKTAWTTQLVVDRQANEIQSLVQQIVNLEDQMSENYSELLQQVDNITATIQTSGGANIIKNSVGYSITEGIPTWWEDSGTGSISSINSTEALAYGAISGNILGVGGASKQIKQNVTVTTELQYSLSFYARKATSGTATISLSNGIDNFEVVLNDGTSYGWQQFYIEGISPSENFFDITVKSTNAINFFITDIMLANGETKRPWEQNSSEIVNSAVRIDDEGIEIRSSVYNGYSKITPQQFSTLDNNNNRGFSASDHGVEATNIWVDETIDTATARIVQIPSGENAGMAVVMKGNS